MTSRARSWHRGSVTSPSPTPRRGPRLRLLAVSVALAGLVGALAGCGTENAPPREVVVTVTGSPSATATSDASPGASPSQGSVKSDDVGRRFDFGVVTSVDTQGDTQVLVFDRWTDPKVDDRVLAQKGIDVTTYDKAKNPYRNVNTTVTFRIPVQDGTSFLLHHCVQKGEPVTSRSVSPQELAKAADADKLVLLSIDPSNGYTTGGETFAGC